MTVTEIQNCKNIMKDMELVANELYKISNLQPYELLNLALKIIELSNKISGTSNECNTK